MPTVAAALRVRKGGAPVAHLITDQAVPYSLAYTPEQFQMGGIAPKWGSVDRPGLTPYTNLDSQQLRTLQFTHTLAAAGGAAITGQLSRLKGLARSGKRVRIVGWAPGGPRWWNVADLAIQVTRLNANQEAVQADLSWQLVEYAAVRPKIGRVRPRTTKTTGATITRYTVKSGDTVYSIAQAQLGDSSRWTEIVDLNPDVFPYGVPSAAGSSSGRDQSGGRDTGSSFRAGVVLILPAAAAPSTGAVGGGAGGRRAAVA